MRHALCYFACFGINKLPRHGRLASAPENRSRTGRTRDNTMMMLQRNYQVAEKTNDRRCHSVVGIVHFDDPLTRTHCSIHSSTFAVTASLSTLKYFPLPILKSIRSIQYENPKLAHDRYVACFQKSTFLTIDIFLFSYVRLLFLSTFSLPL